jgi:MFS family permease
MRSVWMPAVAFLIAVAMQSGVNWSLAVLTFIHRGVANGAIIFTSMALATFALRYPAARMAEKYGPRNVAIPVAVAQIAGCIVAAHASSAVSVAIAGILLGIAWAGVVPVGIGLFFAQSGKRTRGAAMGAYNLSFAIGTSSGALLSAIVTKLGHDYTVAMLTCAAVCAIVVPWVYFVTGKRAARGVQRAAA